MQIRTVQEIPARKHVHVDTHDVSHTHKLKVPWLMEALVGIVLQQRPGDTVV